MALYKQSIHSLYYQPLRIEHLQPLLQICNNILLNHFMSTHRKRKPPKVVLPRPQISEKKLYKRFVDYLPVRVKGGDGGNGLVAFSSLMQRMGR
ncbi:hypothetical protein EB796_014800 [Bugula neritina]|uniref:Obg domain-containing protein n=1 Tax=Bugula neritina TaxID=10212 RepID=A0A7J7JKP4_BUGNE|nr:hypothetical protein EB796_014800 [Bugula neritina]